MLLRVLAAASLILFFCSAAPSKSPEALIQSLYARHQPKKDKSLNWCNKKTISSFVDARLTALFIKDCQCAKRTGEICQLDSDPFYDAQDFDDTDPNPRVKEIAPDTYAVTISNFGDQKFIYKMTKTSAGWRISDIEGPTNKSLLKLLSMQ